MCSSALIKFHNAPKKWVFNRCTQRLENPHNALVTCQMNSCISPEDVARSWIIHFFILEALVHGVIQRNTCRYKLLVNWILGFMHNSRDRVQDKSFNLTTGAARFNGLLNHKQTMQKQQSFRYTQCLNSLTRFHSLFQVNCISGLM